MCQLLFLIHSLLLVDDIVTKLAIIPVYPFKDNILCPKVQKVPEDFVYLGIGKVLAGILRPDKDRSLSQVRHEDICTICQTAHRIA